MRQTIRLFLLVEGLSFAIAGSIHFGALIDGYQHWQAALAESTIAVAVLVGLALTWAWPLWTRSLGIAAQSFALLLTLVGAFTIAVSVGPRTVPDVAYHVAILAALATGLFVATRTPATNGPRPA